MFFFCFVSVVKVRHLDLEDGMVYLISLGTAPNTVGIEQPGIAGCRVGRVRRAGHRRRGPWPLGLAIVLSF